MKNNEDGTHTPKAGPKEGKPIARVMSARTIQEKAFQVFRDDETDQFKPTSVEAIELLAATPMSKPLTADEKGILHAVAADLERSISMENIHDEPPIPRLPDDVQEEIEKMPSWLGAMIAFRYNKIREYFKNETLDFLKNINRKIDKEYRPEFAYFEGIISSEDGLDFEDELDNRTISDLSLQRPEEEGTSREKLFKSDGNVVFIVSEAIGKWKRSKDNSKMWHPRLVHAVAKKLRHDLTLKPSPADLALTRQDVIPLHHSESEDSEFDEFGKPKWEVIKRREVAQRDAEFEMELDMARVPKNRKTPAYIDEQAVKQNEKMLSAKVKALKRKRNEKGLGRVETRRQLFTRGHFRRHSKLLTSGCGQKSGRPKRLEYHYRSDDTFHHYIVAMVSSLWFRSMIMLIIMINAIVLTIEPLESSKNVPLLWKMIDEIFLAVYLIEAILKIYAHPLGYWRSGFNVFDFCILCISLVKIINDWLDVADISFLRVLIIVRALRILRGISLSIELQVLVAALAQTVKTHVLSVVLLLVLLLYIAAIVAYYLFTDKGVGLRASWGFVPLGMLRMIVFVTMDGWTEILEEFENAGHQIYGRIFNLICIVLGNFMFSNIFIAIIILNISEATALYKERMKREKQDIVRRKKENVFRRQKLDMRQLLARQKKASSLDFYQLAEQFQKLLRHDDMVKMSDVVTSPLWIDACYKTVVRAHHTSLLLMNLHRMMADNMTNLWRLYSKGKVKIQAIRRGRYNRYMRIKAKLALVKKEILHLRNDPPKQKLRVKLPVYPEDSKTKINTPGPYRTPSDAV